MASWDIQLISRVIREGDLAGVIEWGITPRDFTTPEGRTIYGQIVAYHSRPETAGSVWGPEALKERFPNFILQDDPSMTTDALCMEVRKNRVKAETRSLMAQAQEMVEQDPAKAITLLVQKSADLQNDCSPKKLDVHFADAFDRVVHNMELLEQGHDLSVMPWPWEPIQSKTLGIQRHDYIVFYGRPKSMKTWVLCFIVALAVESGLRVLVYTKEMPPDEIFERVGCIMAGVSYEHFVSNTLVPEEKNAVYRVREYLQFIRDNQTIVCLSGRDAPGGEDTVSWFGSKVDKYRPEICFIDGMYLMRDEYQSRKLHERVKSISNALRLLILQKDVPIVATTQANREAAKNEDAETGEVAFSDSLGQDCTHLIRVVNEKDQDTLALVMGSTTRRFKLNGFRIWGIPALNFGYYGELDPKEARKAVKKDDEEEKEALGKKNGAPRKARREVDKANDAFKKQLS